MARPHSPVAHLPVDKRQGVIVSTESSPEPTREAAFFTTIRSWGIVRGDNRVFGGVLSGVGARIGLAPAPARIIFVLIALVTSGLGTLAYAAAWALLPDSEGRIIIQDFGRGRPNVGALVAIAVLVILSFTPIGRIGVFDAYNWGSNPDGWFTYGPEGDMHGYMSGFGRAFVVLAAILIPLAILGGLAAFIVWAVRSSKRANPAPQGFARMPDGTIPDGTVPAAPAEPSVVAEPLVVAADAVAYAVPGPAPAPIPAPPSSGPRVYSAPPTPPRPRVPGPGKVGYLMALAWIPITLAITLYLSTTDQLAVFPALVGGVIYVAGLGLILIITALRGRKLGFLGFVSVMALIPVTIAIGSATELREQYASGDWRVWFEDHVDPPISGSAEYVEPVFTPEPFDPTDSFSEYATVAIAGQCSSDYSGPTPDATGTISLGDVSAPTTLTIATDVTRVVIPTGTNLAIVNPSSSDSDPYVGVTWVARGVSCSMTSGVENLVTLNSPGAPVLTLVLGGENLSGQFDIYIEEN